MGYRHGVLVLAGFAGAFTLLGPDAMAAGYGLREYSANAMGGAFAGSSATASDPSYIAYNPALLSGVDGVDGSITITGIMPSSSASYPVSRTSAGTAISGSSAASGFISDALVPDVSVRARLSDRWSVGVAIYVPWGLSTTYPSNSVVRYYAESTQLLTTDIAPMVAYQVSSTLTLGLGAEVQYAKGVLSSGVDIGTLGALSSIPGAVPGANDGSARLVGHDWSPGYNAGLLWQLDDNVTVGLSYHSAISHQLGGNLNYSLDSGGIGVAIRSATSLFSNTIASAVLTTPDSVNLGGRAVLSPQWTVLFEADWTNWSRFHQLQVVAANPVQPDDITVANWKSAMFGALGVEYKAADRWLLKSGVAYDQSPVPQTTLSPRIPDGDRINLTIGASYQASEAVNLGLSYEHLFIADRRVSQDAIETGNALRGTLAGETFSSVDVLAMQVSYRPD